MQSSFARARIERAARDCRFPIRAAPATKCSRESDLVGRRSERRRRAVTGGSGRPGGPGRKQTAAQHLLEWGELLLSTATRRPRAPLT